MGIKTGLTRNRSGGMVEKNRAVVQRNGFSWRCSHIFYYCENHAFLFEGTILRTIFIEHKFFKGEMVVKADLINSITILSADIF